MTTAPAASPASLSLSSVPIEIRSSIVSDAPGLRNGENVSIRATVSRPGTERARSSASSVGTMPPLLSRVMVIGPPRETISTVGSARILTTLRRNLRAVPVEYLGTSPHDDALLTEDIVVQHLEVFDPVWHAREIRVNRDRHHARCLRAVVV